LRTLTASSTLASFVLLAGCVDPKSRLTEFEDRVVDAAPVVTIDAHKLEEVPDVGGSWYVAFRPANLGETNDLFALWTLGFTRDGDGAKIDITSHGLSVDEPHVPVGDDFVVTAVPVNSAGEFLAAFTAWPIDRDANAFHAPLKINAKIAGTIKSKDIFCGVIPEGEAFLGTVRAELAGSTFAAQRIAPGTQGTALPPPMIECPPDLPDAGVPDATVDADLPDAGVPDAAPLPDAPLPDAV
jgi:hypothetical protein